MRRSIHSMESDIGVPLGEVTAKPMDSAPLSSRIAPSRWATVAIASSQPISSQPGSSAPLGRVLRSGVVSLRALCAISGAARPFGHSAVPVGCAVSGSTRVIRPDSTV